MPKWTEEDRERERRIREIRRALVSIVDWSNEPDPMADLEAFMKEAGAIAGLKPDRGMYFFCGLHGQQGISKILWAGIELKCGCRLTGMTSYWEFSTKEERDNDDQE